MERLLSDEDIKLLQELQRCERDLEYARGENKISLLVYHKNLEGIAREKGILILV